jgi:hypothetical protein
VQVFLNFFTNPVWQLLVDGANRHLAHLHATAIKPRPEYRDTDIREMQRFYAYVMCIENTWGNETKVL